MSVPKLVKWTMTSICGEADAEVMLPEGSTKLDAIDAYLTARAHSSGHNQKASSLHVTGNECKATITGARARDALRKEMVQAGISNESAMGGETQVKTIEFERHLVTFATPWHVEPPPDFQAPYGEVRGVMTDDEFIVLWGGDAFVYFMVFPIHGESPEKFSKIVRGFQPWTTTDLWSEAEWSFAGRVKFDGTAWKHEYCSNFDVESLAHDADVAALVFRTAWEIFGGDDRVLRFEMSRMEWARSQFLSPNYEFVERQSNEPPILVESKA